MKIIHLYKCAAPNSYGGVEAAIDYLAHEQATSGHDVEVVAVAGLAGQIDFNGYRVTTSKQLFSAGSTPFSAGFLRDVIQKVRRVDIVHVHFPYPFADLCVLLSGCDTPIVVTYHSDIVRQKLLRFVYWPLMKIFLNRANRLVSTSPNYLATSSVLDEFKAKVDVVPLGARDQNPPDRPKRSHPLTGDKEAYRSEPYFLFVGEFRYYKGLDILIEAASSVSAYIVLVGAGPLEKRLKNKVEKLGLKNVSFPGQLSHEEKLQYYDRAFAVVLPSHLRSEALGMTLIEGAMFGLPLISCEIGTGTSFVNIDNETGLVCPPSDPVALADAMNKLVANPDLAEALGKQARKRFETLFTTEKMAAEYGAIYAALLAKQGRRQPTALRCR